MAVESSHLPDVFVIIVGYDNPEDIVRCLAALARMHASPHFNVLICENGGRAAYENLTRRLLEESACCDRDAQTEAQSEAAPSPFLSVRHFKLKMRSCRVTVACANANLGYAGGINAWLRQILPRSGWKGVWILNPDAEPASEALNALVARTEAGGKGMVGSTILESGSQDVVRFRGGLRWRRLMARAAAIGIGERVDATIDLARIEQAMDAPSGASMYVTRRCIEEIGLMDESYFLFFEDLDWGLRAKRLGLGYARDSVVKHERGTTTGSAGTRASLSRLSVYLEHRNAIHFVRRHYPWTLPMRIAMTIVEAARFLLSRAPRNGLVALSGMSAGLRGEKGVPGWYTSRF